MARKTFIDTEGGMCVIVRAASPEIGLLFDTIFRRYPSKEWATFARFGWRETSEGLVLTLAGLDLPEAGDLDEDAHHVIIQEPYTLRAALSAEGHALAVGVVHSHPEGYQTYPSWIDDDMDAYYASYFADFAPERPYASLIFAFKGEVLSATGRVFWKGRWHAVERFAIEGEQAVIGNYQPPQLLSAKALALVARLESAFGTEAAERLAASTVAVIGASGTGSPAIEVLARAGVGHLIVVDPDVFTNSNLERVHGSIAIDAGTEIPKVELAMRHIHQINPACRVTAIKGSLPQSEVVDAVITADVILGCTDKQHSRLALSDIATRYLIPALDCGVALEGQDGCVSGQVIQLVRFLPSDPCALCRQMIIQWRLDQELMTEEERQQRRKAAQEAEARGEAGNAYWRDMPQLNTVGYLTTATGSLAAGYLIGWLTKRFAPPFEHLQMDLSQPYFNVTDDPKQARPFCDCRKMRGLADQGNEYALITAPLHWPDVKILSNGRR